jgi:hypothetical protein
MTTILATRIEKVDAMSNDELVSFARLINVTGGGLAAESWGVPTAIVLARRGMGWPTT